MSSCRQEDEWQVAMGLFNEMRSLGNVSPDVVSYNIAMGGLELESVKK